MILSIHKLSDQTHEQGAFLEATFSAEVVKPIELCFVEENGDFPLLGCHVRSPFLERIIAKIPH